MARRKLSHNSTELMDFRDKAGARGTPCLDERQREFAAAILDPDSAPPPGLVGPNGEPSARRFAVYRNNVVAGLIEALKAAFPATLRIVGDDFFSAMARLYVVREPPQSPIMLDYGAGFAGFVGAFGPAECLVYLRDVARLERAWLEAYHAADAPPLDPARLRDIRPDDLPHVRFMLHPSVRVVRSSFPAVTIWQMNVGEGAPGPVDIGRGGEDALIVRPEAEVEVRTLPAGAAPFVQRLAKGMPVADAADAALHADPDFDLAAAFAGLLAVGAIVDWTLSAERYILTNVRPT